jgi:hypothetical protein
MKVMSNEYIPSHDSHLNVCFILVLPTQQRIPIRNSDDFTVIKAECSASISGKSKAASALFVLLRSDAPPPKSIESGKLPFSLSNEQKSR